MAEIKLDTGLIMQLEMAKNEVDDAYFESILGSSGYIGISGYSGVSGWSGFSGISGYSGVGFAGASGISGYSGIDGATGLTGDSGTSGYSGQDGMTGGSGTSGYSGYQGVQGIMGFSGYSGADGVGTSGYSGIDGTAGTSGYSGVSGYSGAAYGTVVPKTSTYGVSTADNGLTFTMTSGSSQNFNLPSVGASDVGISFTFVKLGAGTVVIDAADSDTIADSGAGSTIYNSQSGEVYATITLQLASETKWVITGSMGTWVTTT
jgi:hypothetical protein